jgi:hypothetical protein
MIVQLYTLQKLCAGAILLHLFALLSNTKYTTIIIIKSTYICMGKIGQYHACIQ